MQLDCQSCGACCKGLGVDVSTSDEDVPQYMVKDDRLMGPQMRVRKGACIALRGLIGSKVCCSIYEGRPQVCRDFDPGSDLCMWARKQAGLPHTLSDSAIPFELSARVALPSTLHPKDS